jgi:hypothetical protein
MVTGYVQFDVCAEGEETVEHRTYGISHRSETAALINRRLMSEYYGSLSCDGHESVINHRNFKRLVQNFMRFEVGIALNNTRIFVQLFWKIPTDFSKETSSFEDLLLVHSGTRGSRTPQIGSGTRLTIWHRSFTFEF